VSEQLRFLVSECEKTSSLFRAGVARGFWRVLEKTSEGKYFVEHVVVSFRVLSLCNSSTSSLLYVLLLFRGVKSCGGEKSKIVRKNISRILTQTYAQL